MGPLCGREGLGVVVFSPLAQGVLTGTYRKGAPPPAGSRAADPQHNQFIGRYMTPEHLDRVEKLGGVARELGVSLSVLALAWCLRQRWVSSVITGATNVKQLEENLATSGVTIPGDALEKIERILT